VTGEGELCGDDAGLVVGAHENGEEGIEDDPGCPEKCVESIGGGQSEASEEERDARDEEPGFLVRNDAEDDD
jgi:hypothetical protein